MTSKANAPVLPSGSPVQHSETGDVGLVRGSTWERGHLWYSVEWFTGDLAPNAMRGWVREVPNEMEFLALVSR